MIDVERFLNLRYDGTDVAMMTQSTEGQSYEEVISFSGYTPESTDK